MFWDAKVRSCSDTLRHQQDARCVFVTFGVFRDLGLGLGLELWVKSAIITHQRVEGASKQRMNEGGVYSSIARFRGRLVCKPLPVTFVNLIPDVADPHSPPSIPSKHTPPLRLR